MIAPGTRLHSSERTELGSRCSSSVGRFARFVSAFALAAVPVLACEACKDDPKVTPPEAATSAASSAAAVPSGEVHLPGIDASALLPRERKEWSAYVTEFLAPCPEVAVSVAQCVQEKRACAKCMSAAKFLLKAVRAGYPREAVEKAYKNRFDPTAIKSIPVDGSPSIGPADAPITMIEFADFECPFCAMEYPVLERAMQERPGKIRIVYKVKLIGHPHGEIAARAALAAEKQGKFWEMHHKIFDNQKALEQRDLEKYAKEIGIDVGKMTADMKSPAVTEQIEKDKKLSEGLGIDHTPTIYINGRDFDPNGDLNDWLAEELGETRPQKPSPLPSGSASGPSIASAPPSAAPPPSASASSKPAASAKGK
jgi:protein-disulfide isomerase